jgi:hypothetical protein
MHPAMSVMQARLQNDIFTPSVGVIQMCLGAGGGVIHDLEE